MKTRKKRLKPAQYIEGILQFNKVIFSQAITLIESQLPSDQALAQEVMQAILPHTGGAIRVGITGVPGVGKSTFIEALGRYLTAQQKRLAVLAIDPSSQRSKGSIMGDKTRMAQLSIDPLAYVRPSPTQSSLGGVARRTREIMLLCEAAGFEVVFIETVGVGQSETVVHGMVDFFLLLMLAGAGDELQGIKKGIMEMADGLVIHKADGDNLHPAQVAKRAYENALHLFPLGASQWPPQVLTCSSLNKEGIPEVWQLILDYVKLTQENGFFQNNRQEQNRAWLHDTIQQYLEYNFYHHPEIQKNLSKIEDLVAQGGLPVQKAASLLLNQFQGIKPI